jgi:hypothetical protein
VVPPCGSPGDGKAAAMTLTPFQLAAAVGQALDVLEAAGIPRDLVVLGVTNPHDPARDGTWYDLHVGATRDDDDATLVQLVADHIAREARRAAVALTRRESCPRCGSPRLAFDQPRDGRRVLLFDDCLDCDYRQERHP